MSLSPSPAVNGHAINGSADRELVDKSQAVLIALADVIQSTVDTAKMEELLALNDSVMTLLSEVDEILTGSTPNGSAPHSRGSSQASSDHEHEVLPKAETDLSFNNQVQEHDAKANGLTVNIPPLEHDVSESEDEVLSPETPRVDKGKRRAEPEPAVIEKVLSPTYLIAGSDDEYEEGKLGFVGEPDGIDDGPSPLDLYVLKYSYK